MILRLGKEMREEKDFIEEKESEVDLPMIGDQEEKIDDQEPVYLHYLDDDTKTMKLDAAEIPEYIPQHESWFEEREPEQPKNDRNRFLIALIIVLAVILAALCGILYLHEKEKAAAAQPVNTATGWILPSSEPLPTPSASATASASAESSASPSAASDAYGTLTVNVDSITKRDQPSQNGNSIGSAVNGETYQVLAIQEAEGYTWYEIAENTWIASEGTWVSYSEPQQ